MQTQTLTLTLSVNGPYAAFTLSDGNGNGITPNVNTSIKPIHDNTFAIATAMWTSPIWLH